MSLEWDRLYSNASEYLKRCEGNPCFTLRFICRYETVTARSEDLERPYKALAKMLNCQPSNIAIVQSATSAWTQVLHLLSWLHLAMYALLFIGELHSDR